LAQPERNDLIALQWIPGPDATRADSVIVRHYLPGWSRSDDRYLPFDALGGEHRIAEDVDFDVELSIADKPSSIPSLFTVRIVTPQALARARPTPSGLLASRATLVVAELDWQAIRRHLEALVDGYGHLEVVHATDLLQQHFRWEYDDFNQGPSTPPLDGALQLRLENVTAPGHGSLRSLYPADDTTADYRLELLVRAHGTSETAVLSTRVVTPSSLSQLPKPPSCVIAGHPILVVSHFDWRDVLITLEEIVDGCSARMFDQVVWRLRRFFSLVHRDVPERS